MTGGQWGGKQGMWGPTGTGRSNAYFVASLNGGPPGPEFHPGWQGPPAPCRATTGQRSRSRGTKKLCRQGFCTRVTAGFL